MWLIKRHDLNWLDVPNNIDVPCVKRIDINSPPPTDICYGELTTGYINCGIQRKFNNIEYTLTIV